MLGDVALRRADEFDQILYAGFLERLRGYTESSVATDVPWLSVIGRRCICQSRWRGRVLPGLPGRQNARFDL